MSTASADERIPSFTVGDRLRKAREKTGLDQAEFAVECGFSRGTVSNYERAHELDGLKRPYLMAWAMRADVPLEWLTQGASSTTPPPPGPGKPPNRDDLARLTEQKRGRTRATRPGATNGRYFADAA